MFIKYILFLFTVSLFPFSSYSQSEACKTKITSSTKMLYSTKKLVIPSSCTNFTIEFAYIGKLKKNIMGHNLVIAKSKEMDAVLKKALIRGLKYDYLPGPESSIVASTKLLSGGEKETIILKMDKFNFKESYSFFCTFPGHSALMKGEIEFK